MDAPDAGITRISSADNATSTGQVKSLGGRDNTLAKGQRILGA